MRSVFASGSRGSRLASGAALALCAAACGVLDVSPGGDFGVRVLNATPIQAVGKISVPIRLAIDGCNAFQVTVGTGGATHAIEVVRDGDAFVADVPVDWLRSQEGACLRGADQPVSSVARVDVTCGDAGRTASAAFELSYATADLVLHAATAEPGLQVTYLYPSGDPLRPRALLPAREPGAYSPLLSTYWTQGTLVYEIMPMGFDWASYRADPLHRPRIVTGDDAVFITAGCFDPSACAPVEVAPGALVPSEEIWAESLTRPEAWAVHVPAHVLDIAPLPNGELLVVSHFASLTGANAGFPRVHPHDTAVARVTLTPYGSDGRRPDPPGTVQIIGYFPEEAVMTQLSRTADGRLAFVTYQRPDGWRGPFAFLNVTDGYAIERTPDLNTGIRPDEDVWRVDTGLLLSPDASTVLLGGFYIGPTGAHTWTTLPVDIFSSRMFHGDGGGVWTPDALVLWGGAPVGTTFDTDVGRVEAFDLAPPHARLFRYDVAPLPSSSGHAVLHGTVAVGDYFALTTNTGVRVLDRAGKVVGGADPLPCGTRPTAVAIATGPAQAAVGTAEDVLVLDLSKLPAPATPR